MLDPGSGKESGLLDRSISGILWVALDKVAGSGVNFIITVLLARLLFPEDFGLVAMAMVFFEVSAVFVESGFSTALIREREISDADRSTTFLFNMATAVLLYAMLFLAAPWIAAFFATPALALIVRVMGLNLIIDAASIVRSSAFIQQVDFRSQAFARFGAVAVSGCTGVAMAYAGYGVWALVVRMLLNGTVLALLLYRLHPWRIALVFDRDSFRRLFGFGSRILLAGLLDKAFAQVYRLLIGKFYAAVTLGFYTQAGSFVNMVVRTLFRPVQTVSYPVLSKLRDDIPRLRSGYRSMLRAASFVMFPALTVMAVLAELLIAVLISEKWLGAAVYVRLLCIAAATVHISTVNLNALLVLGRSDLSLRLEVIKKINITAAILIGFPFGVKGLVIGETIVAWLNLLINAWYSRALLGYRPADQLRDVLPTLVLSLIMGLGIHLLLGVLPLKGTALLLVLMMAGSSGYLALHAALRTREWRLVAEVILPRVGRMLPGLLPRRG